MFFSESFFITCQDRSLHPYSAATSIAVSFPRSQSFTRGRIILIRHPFPRSSDPSPLSSPELATLRVHGGGTLATAISKSSCVTCTLRSRRANMPASEQTAFVSAPDASFIAWAILRRSMPRVKFIRREWMVRMSSRASSFGLGNSIFLSIRPTHEAKCVSGSGSGEGRVMREMGLE